MSAMLEKMREFVKEYMKTRPIREMVDPGKSLETSGLTSCSEYDIIIEKAASEMAKKFEDEERKRLLYGDPDRPDPIGLLNEVGAGRRNGKISRLAQEVQAARAIGIPIQYKGESFYTTQTESNNPWIGKTQEEIEKMCQKVRQDIDNDIGISAEKLFGDDENGPNSNAGT